MIHELDIHEKYYDVTKTGRKCFEIRPGNLGIRENHLVKFVARGKEPIVKRVGYLHRIDNLRVIFGLLESEHVE